MSSGWFLNVVRQVVDGASSHVAKVLVVPENIRLLRLPPYAPDLTPPEHVWDELREKESPDRVFADLPGVTQSRVCPASPLTPPACAVSRPGPGLLVST